MIACGNKLGDMTDELKPGEYINEFVSGGPNNYAYKIHNRYITKEPKIVCKVRGITLNSHASRLVNFDAIRRMILRGEPDIVTVHTDKKIKQKRKGGVALIKEPEEKVYKISFHKTRRLNDTSVPFGYINEGVSDTVT
jgi:hypothetical protein